MKKEMTRYDIPKEILDEMLAPGYGPLETGYKVLPDGEGLRRDVYQISLCQGQDGGVVVRHLFAQHAEL